VTQRVHVWSRKQIEELETPPAHDATLISITTPGGPPYDNRHGWRRVLRLSFGDVTKTPLPTESVDPRERLFTWEQAIDVLEFAGQNLHCEWHVHCDAGVSRSVGVGRFLAEHFGRVLKLHATHTDLFANPYVLRMLREAAGGGYSR